MASTRYPGKVLAPFHNKPLIYHLLERVQRVPHVRQIVVLTTCDTADDPLVAYLEKIGCHYFRGSTLNVFERFQKALQIYPCDYFVRLCADSPCLNTEIIEVMLQEIANHSYDIVTNALHKTFPQGQSVEIMKSARFLDINSSILSAYESEHVMPFFYQAKTALKMLSIQNKINQNMHKTCIDTLEDLHKFILNFPTYTFKREDLCKLEC